MFNRRGQQTKITGRVRGQRIQWWCEPDAPGHVRVIGKIVYRKSVIKVGEPVVCRFVVKTVNPTTLWENTIRKIESDLRAATRLMR